MDKIALLFPGQGAQYVGMEEIYNEFKIAKIFLIKVMIYLDLI